MSRTPGYLADENFNGRILRALLRRIEHLDVLRAQDTTHGGCDDPTLLQVAADLGRVVLTHDIATLVGHAHDRVLQGQPMPGVIALRSNHPIGALIDDLELLILASEPGELENLVLFVPL